MKNQSLHLLWVFEWSNTVLGGEGQKKIVQDYKVILLTKCEMNQFLI